VAGVLVAVIAGVSASIARTIQERSSRSMAACRRQAHANSCDYGGCRLTPPILDTSTAAAHLDGGDAQRPDVRRGSVPLLAGLGHLWGHPVGRATYMRRPKPMMPLSWALTPKSLILTAPLRSCTLPSYSPLAAAPATELLLLPASACFCLLLAFQDMRSCALPAYSPATAPAAAPAAGQLGQAVMRAASLLPCCFPAAALTSTCGKTATQLLQHCGTAAQYRQLQPSVFPPPAAGRHRDGCQPLHTIIACSYALRTVLKYIASSTAYTCACTNSAGLRGQQQFLAYACSACAAGL
jgi:hypothetical protein